MSYGNILRSVQGCAVDALFNLEGTEENVPKEDVEPIRANSSAG